MNTNSYNGWNIPNIPDKIGNVDIYFQQKIAGLKLFYSIMCNRVARLDAQTQSGKTNVAIVFYYLLREYYMSRYSHSPKMMYLLNMPDNEIRKQNDERFQMARLDIEVHHSASYDKLNLNDKQSTFILFDEWHYGLNTGGQFDKLLNSIEIKNLTGKPNNIQHWGKSAEHIHIGLISATPFDSQLVCNDWPENVWLDVGPEYEGFEDHRKNGRLFQSDKNDDHFFSLVEKMKSSGEKGICIKRSIGTKTKKLKDRLEKIGVKCKIYSSDTDQKIEDLRKRLRSNNYVEIEVAIIKNGLRAGMTLVDKNFPDILDNVKLWYDTHDANAATVVQSVGRLTGNMRGRYGNFPIYCNMVEMNSIINWYSAKGDFSKINSIPTTTNSTKYGKDVEYVIRLFDTREEAVDNLKKWHVSTDWNECVRHVSKTNVTDLAQIILNDMEGKEYSEKNKGGLHRANAIHVDGPNTYHKSSYKNLPSNFYDKYIVYEPIKKEKETKLKREICLK